MLHFFLQILYRGVDGFLILIILRVFESTIRSNAIPCLCYCKSKGHVIDEIKDYDASLFDRSSSARDTCNTNLTSSNTLIEMTDSHKKLEKIDSIFDDENGINTKNPLAQI